MIVNRAMTPGPRPELQHRTTDISARSVRPGASYAAPVILQQQDKPRNEISARRPPKTPARFDEPATESDEEEDEDEEEEESTEDDEDDEEANLEILKKLQASQMAQDRRAKQSQIAAARAKLEADRIAMPPPKSTGTQSTGAQFSMRRPTQNPKITYGAPTEAPSGDAELAAALRQMGIGPQRPPLVPGAGKASTYAHPAFALSGGLAADMAARQQPRRNSFYAGEGADEMQANHQAMLHAAGVYGREKEQRRLQQQHILQQQQLLQQQKRASADVEGLYGDQLRARFQNLALDHGSSPPTVDPKLRDAQSYIERLREGAPREQAQLTEGVVRRLDRDATSTRSKRSSREGSSTAGRSRRKASVAGQVEADAEGIKMRIDTKQDYEIEIGNQRVEIRPSGEGSLDLYIGGKRETPYHSTRGSTSTGGSKLGRRPSGRAARDRDRALHDDESDIPEEREEREAAEEREEQRSTRSGGSRRRAETYGTYETERARYETERARRVPLTRRTTSRDARDEDASRERDRSREQRYRGPPRYGVAPDEYSRSPPTPSSYQRYGVPRYDTSSPRPQQGYGYGGAGNQNYNGFGA
jgi:hypothetical protein